MTFNEYQNEAMKTAIYPYKDSLAGLNYTVLGLVGEAGELANKLKKTLRDKTGVVDGDTRLALTLELGDCLWYCAALAYELHMDLGTVASLNLDKLARRKERQTLGGSGDQR